MLSIHYFIFISRIYFGINKTKSDKSKNVTESTVTIIIVFRNEEESLLKLLVSLDKLEHSKSMLELIFINDNSTDKSVEIIRNNISFSNYKIIDLTKSSATRSFKKRAIEQAVKIATGEIIFITDADCVVPPKWIHSTLKCFDDDVALVTGPVTFMEASTFFQKFQKLEYAGLNLVGAGLIGIGKPKLASAANLAFRKKVFEQINGYEGIDQFSSGDDELLMQKIQDQTYFRIRYCFSSDTVVETKGNTTIREFANQRQRWASKSLYYRDKIFVLELILITLFYLSLPLSLLLGLVINKGFLIVFVISILLKVIPEYLVLIQGVDFLFKKSLLRIFPIAQIIQIPYIIISSILGVKGNFYWKGRKLKR